MAGQDVRESKEFSRNDFRRFIDRTLNYIESFSELIVSFLSPSTSPLLSSLFVILPRPSQFAANVLWQAD